MGFYVESKNSFGRKSAVGCGRVLGRRKGNTIRVRELEDGNVKIFFTVTVDATKNKETNKFMYKNVNIAVYSQKVSEQVFKMAEKLGKGETVIFGGSIWEHTPMGTGEEETYHEVQAEMLAYPEDLLSGANGTEVTKTAGGKRRVRKIRKQDIAPVEKYGFR